MHTCALLNLDVNECLKNNGGCDSKRKCMNTAGSMKCGDCPNGSPFKESTDHFKHFCSPYYNNRDRVTLAQCKQSCGDDKACAAFYWSAGRGRGNNDITHCGLCRAGYQMNRHGGHDYRMFMKTGSSGGRFANDGAKGCKGLCRDVGE